MSATETSHPGINLGATDKRADAAVEGAVFGFWIFLMSDAVIFALLFAVYGTMVTATVGGPTPGGEYKIGPALIETLVLLSSSFTFGMASIALKHESRRGVLLGWLGGTLLFGLVFLGLELHDFATMVGNGAVPMRSGFLSAFFALVPLHGLHVLAGCLWLVVMMLQLPIFGPDERVKVNVLRLGLFWHFLDIIWVAIFSVVYLQGLIR